MLFLLLIWHILTIKYVNPYTMDLYIAKKGAGKSATIAKMIIRSKKRGNNIYVNSPDLKIKDVNIYDTYDLGKGYIENAHLFVDEVSLFYDNRKSMQKGYMKDSEQFVAFLRECRHDKLMVDLFTQSYDCDKKIRTMCDNIYIGHKFLRVLTVWRRLRKDVKIKQDGLNAESQIVDSLDFDYFFIPGAIKITFIPKYIKYFDSFKKLQNYDHKLKSYVNSDGYEIKGKARGHAHKTKKSKN